MKFFKSESLLAIVAIIKNIEKTHHKPTTAILQTLFEETSNIEKEEEEYNFETPILITENEELTYYRNKYYTSQGNYNALKYDVENIIKKTKYIKSNFGTGHFRLEITKEEFEQSMNTKKLVAFLSSDLTSKSMASAFINGIESEKQTAGVKSTLANAFKEIS